MQVLRCLSIQQPHAALILNGRKDVENRTWNTKYRGVLYIHAGKRYDQQSPIAPIEPSRRKAIIGRVTLVECVKWSKRHLPPWHQFGMIGWYLADPEILVDPIPYRGRLGLMKLEHEIAEQLLAAEYRPGRSYE